MDSILLQLWDHLLTEEDRNLWDHDHSQNRRFSWMFRDSWRMEHICRLPPHHHNVDERSTHVDLSHQKSILEKSLWLSWFAYPFCQLFSPLHSSLELIFFDQGLHLCPEMFFLVEWSLLYPYLRLSSCVFSSPLHDQKQPLSTHASLVCKQVVAVRTIQVLAFDSPQDQPTQTNSQKE